MHICVTSLCFVTVLGTLVLGMNVPPIVLNENDHDSWSLMDSFQTMLSSSSMKRSAENDMGLDVNKRSKYSYDKLQSLNNVDENVVTVVRFVSSDGVPLDVPLSVAEKSTLINHMLEDIQQSSSYLHVVTFSEFDSTTVENVVFLMKQNSGLVQMQIQQYDFNNLIQMFRLIDFLDLKDLFQHTATRLGQLIVDESKYGQFNHNLQLLFNVPNHLMLEIFEFITFENLVTFMDAVNLGCNVIEPGHLGNFLLSFVKSARFENMEAFSRVCNCLAFVQEVTIAPNQITTNAHVEMITSCNGLRKLKSLILDRNQVNEIGAELIAKSKALRSLTKLSLIFNPIGADGAKAIAESENLENLEELNLFCCPIGDMGVQAIAQSEKMKNLKKFRFGFISIEGVKAIAESKHLTNLIQLDFSPNEIGSDGVKAIAESKHLINLKRLDLSRSQVGSDGVKAIAQSEIMTNLQYLDLSNNNIGDVAIVAIAQSNYLTNLQYLDLSSTNIGDAAVIAIVESESMKNLLNLTMNHNNIGDEGVVAFSNSNDFHHLQTLELLGNKIGSPGAVALAQSKLLLNLQYLDLRMNNIGDEGAFAIAQSHLVKKSKKLDLSQNKISSQGVIKIAQCQGLNLQELYLEDNGIGPLGAKAIAESENMKDLKVLWLSYNRIGNNGTKALVQSTNLPNLRSLHLDINKISRSVLVALKTMQFRTLKKLVDLEFEYQRGYEEMYFRQRVVDEEDDPEFDADFGEESDEEFDEEENNEENIEAENEDVVEGDSDEDDNANVENGDSNVHMNVVEQGQLFNTFNEENLAMDTVIHDNIFEQYLYEF